MPCCARCWRSHPRCWRGCWRPSQAAPLKIGRQQRATIVAGVDDPWLQNEDALLGAAADLGLEPAQIHRLASGGHHPHLESVSHPEWTARNVNQLLRVIESMIVTAHEPTSSHPGQLAATPGDTLTADEVSRVSSRIGCASWWRSWSRWRGRR